LAPNTDHIAVCGLADFDVIACQRQDTPNAGIGQKTAVLNEKTPRIFTRGALFWPLGHCLETSR
jgi:hypothetical protein